MRRDISALGVQPWTTTLRSAQLNGFVKPVSPAGKRQSVPLVDILLTRIPGVRRPNALGSNRYAPCVLGCGSNACTLRSDAALSRRKSQDQPTQKVEGL